MSNFPSHSNEKTTYKELYVVLLADTRLLALPLESLPLLKQQSICSVTRDFSLQMLQHRMSKNASEETDTRVLSKDVGGEKVKWKRGRGEKRKEKSQNRRKKGWGKKRVKRKRACPGIEPGTSRTRSENHTPRPTSLLTVLL